eukprot:scaffold8311_cov63-Cyclotella_meneghiniana.AAC.9
MSNKTSLKEWTSDSLHTLLGFADSSLASYLIHVASKGDANAVLRTLTEGGVDVTASGAADRWREFARELVHRSRGDGGAKSLSSSSNNKRGDVTESEMRKRAAGYSLLNDEEEQQQRQQSNTAIGVTKPSEVATVITRGSRDEVESRMSNKREKKKSKRQDKNSTGTEEMMDSSAVKSSKSTRRKKSSHDSDSEEGEEENNVVINQEALWEERERRREERKLSRLRNKKQSNNDDTTIQENDSSSKLTEEERADLERERDKLERDEFAKRLLEKDKKRNNSNKRSSLDDDDDDSVGSNDTEKEARRMRRLKKREDRDKRLARGEAVLLDDDDDSDKDNGSSSKNNTKKKKAISISDMRNESRRAYLQKRTKRELELLERELQDEEEIIAQLGGSSKLTAEEKRELQLKRDILRMAREHGHVEDDGGDTDKKPDGFYRLPEDYDEVDEGRKKKSRAQRGEELLTSRYVEPKEEKSEQQLWEEGQSQMAAGLSRHKKKRSGKNEDEDDDDKYDFVFEEEQIDFVCVDTNKGYDNRKKKKRRESVDETIMEEEDKVLEMRPATKHEKILEGRKKLPVYPYREDFLMALKDHQVLVLVGETGSGKTTQIPQYLHEVGYSELGKIGCTQPRRVAAMSVATRVAEEMNVRVGHEVGYSIRFENCTSKKTVIQYMTDGMLLREFLTEPDLASYSALIIDEAHERTLHTDILFGLVKDVARFRKDLKLIISSDILCTCKSYTGRREGQEEIETANEILTHRTKVLGGKIAELVLCPIYANLPSDQQAKIFEKTPKGARKVVLATNIAETSLTIDGIKYVIDTGFNKETSFNAKTGMESLMVMPISQAAANQRAGRAGRTQPGKCFRLFTAYSFQHELDPNTTPEILRTNMCNVVLMLKSLGIDNLLAFDFMDSPPPDTLIRALEQLYALGALNDRGELTKIGRRMAEFPLDPMLSKTVIVSEKYKCVSEVLSTVSMLSIGTSVFYRPKEKKVHADTARLNFARGGGGDHISLLRCYREWAETDFSPTWCFENFVQIRNMRKARDVREQLEGLCERVEVDHTISDPDNIEAILKAITAGFFYNTARLSKSGDYETVKQRRAVYIHPSSVLAKEEPLPAWVVYFELAFTSKEYMRQVAPIEPQWLIEIAPHYYQESDVVDSKTKKMPKAKG